MRFTIERRLGRYGWILALMGGGLLLSCLSGCGNAAGNLGFAGAGGVIALSGMPGHEIEQVYYLGVFDPHDQLPPQVYRLTVRGQASGISDTRFASGWVQASLIDSLNTNIGFDPASGRAKLSTGGADEKMANLTTGRRLMLFGPEGFREAPKDHRLVLVMGSSPEKFFSAIDNSLAVITHAQREQANSEVSQQLFQAMSAIRNEQKRLDELARDVAADIPEAKGSN